ncbi:helix-turn-helix domain-containing protein [Flavobacterium aestivum]|uniref:helix-turn-helix domain-containing protein n=1 Tax=Flavobacterium aestivum TaxID=3003257 RepID=UPI00228656CA|nr:AraC family transcriptional regulator [Flavobacterium aestivum]
MKYKEHKPNGYIDNFVQCFWEYENADTEILHTILPDGYFDLIAEFDNDILTTVKLTGVWTKPKDITIPKKTKIFAIRFKLLATEYLFQKEIKSILDTVQNLPFNFWNIDTYQSYEFERFVADITNRIDNSIKHLKEIDNRKLKLFEFIYQGQAETVSELSEKVFWSSRQINRYFNQQFGFSLKEFLKIVRCNATYKDISNGNLSPQTNFFDQAHFIKEVKKYTGATPKELHKNKNDRFLQLSVAEPK